MKKIVLVCFIIVIITVLGCSNKAVPTSGESDKASGEADKSAKQEFVVAGQEIAASLDPVKPLTSPYLRNIGAAEALFKVNAKGEIEPALADSAKETEPTAWEIKLRPHARFWSGKPVDANAVIASLERSKALDLQAKPFLDELTFSKVDDYTVQVRTKRNHVQVPLNLSYYQTVIHNAEAKHDAVDTMDMTGMYKVVEFTPKQKMVLEANKTYWGKAPVIPRIVFEEIGDEQTRVLSALSGRSDVALNIAASSMARFAGHKEIRLSATPAANTQTIYINLNKPQFQDVKVRQALSWALDRKELVVFATEGQSFPITTWLSSNPAYAETRNSVYTKHDPDKAAQLLDEAGWKKGADGIRSKDGTPLTLRLMTWGGDKALGEALQNQWSKIGIKAEVQHGDYSLIETARKSGNWDASIEAWNTFGDELTLLTGQYGPEGSANYGGFKDEPTKLLLAQLAEATNQASRHELALKINQRVAEQAPVISLFPRPQITAVSQSLNGFEDHFRQFENVVNANLSFRAK
ncbi:ABC transporter substrate-binding protein [Paenibacillus hodogayensis]|uniref:ABC transporter substrate-binding protein n=1 Tax=Paenibacillus hodogayensis TaxID=279208 RepID=A0ABV5W2S6_9BACL